MHKLMGYKQNITDVLLAWKYRQNFIGILPAWKYRKHRRRYFLHTDANRQYIIL